MKVQNPTLNPEHTAVPMCSQTTSIARGDIGVTMNDDFIIDADGAEDPDFVATKTVGD